MAHTNGTIKCSFRSPTTFNPPTLLLVGWIYNLILLTLPNIELAHGTRQQPFGKHSWGPLQWKTHDIQTSPEFTLDALKEALLAQEWNSSNPLT